MFPRTLHSLQHSCGAMSFVFSWTQAGKQYRISAVSSESCLPGRTAWNKVSDVSEDAAKVAYIDTLTSANPEWDGRDEETAAQKSRGGAGGPVFSMLARPSAETAEKSADGVSHSALCLHRRENITPNARVCMSLALFRDHALALWVCGLWWLISNYF